ncbi:MAG: response regulator [Nonlabens sp.]
MNTGVKTIIHIDDREEDIALVKRVLDKQFDNAQVVSLNDSEQVVEEIRSGEFLKRRADLLLIDIKMPKISGLELLEEFDSDPNYKKIPKVIFSSSTHPTDLENAYNHHVNSFVEKPKSFKDLKHVLLQTVDYWLNINLS